MEEHSFSVKVNKLYDFAEADLQAVDIVATGPDTFHIITDDVCHHARVIATDFNTKSMVIRVDGARHELQLLDEFEVLVEKLGLAAVSGQKMKEVLAPMPGMVLEIGVEVGQEIEAGAPLLILEAMKMENVIKSIGSGKVKEILVSQGQAVEKNQLLIEFE